MLCTRSARHFASGGKLHPLGDDERRDLNLVVVATLTLLRLIIGFSFSMAIGRYDERKNHEAKAPNAPSSAAALGRS